MRWDATITRLLRQRLQKLADRITAEIQPHNYRVFTDSAPVMEKPLAEAAGLGWIGKHTNLINRSAGSCFLLGEIYTDLPLAIDTPASNHCGSCQACLDICPTQAITAPYTLDARRCISYFTIETRGPIPTELRAAMGNRIFGCDDCQLVCPWNKFARAGSRTGFCRPARPGPGRPGGSCSTGARRNGARAPRAVPCDAPDTQAGCAISPWLLAMRRPRLKFWPPWKHDASTRPNWYASMWPGRWHDTQRDRRRADSALDQLVVDQACAAEVRRNQDHQAPVHGLRRLQIIGIAD
jgi:ferredoxin